MNFRTYEVFKAPLVKKKRRIKIADENRYIIKQVMEIGKIEKIYNGFDEEKIQDFVGCQIINLGPNYVVWYE